MATGGMNPVSVAGNQADVATTLRLRSLIQIYGHNGMDHRPEIHTLKLETDKPIGLDRDLRMLLLRRAAQHLNEEPRQPRFHVGP